MRGMLAALALAATVLTSCGSILSTDTPKEPKYIVPPIDEIMETAPPLGPEADGAFIDELQRNGIAPGQGRLMIPLAHATCDALAADVTREEIIGNYTEQGTDPHLSEVVTNAAIKVYCPEQA